MLDRIVGIVLISMSVFLLWSLRTAPFEAASFPSALFVLLIGLSLALIIKTKPQSKSPFENIKDVGVGAFFVIAYILILPKIGFIITTMVFLFVSMNISGYKASQLKKILLSSSITFCAYVVFVIFLGIPL